MSDNPDLEALVNTELLRANQQAEARLGWHIKRMIRKDEGFRLAVKEALRVEDELLRRGL